MPYEQSLKCEKSLLVEKAAYCYRGGNGVDGKLSGKVRYKEDASLELDSFCVSHCI